MTLALNGVQTQCPHNETMALHSSRPWGLYLITFLMALVAAVTAVFWALGTLAVSQPRAPMAVLVPGAAPSDPQTLARALGGGVAAVASAAPAVSSQYQLVGVVAGPVGKGYALLVVGNAPPKSFAVGAALGDGRVLQSVSARGATIGNALQSETTAELSLPKPAGN